MLNRNEIENQYKWDLSPIFENDEKFFESLNNFKTKMQEIENFKGTLKDKENILAFLKKDDEFSKEIERLYSYAFMNSHLDTTVSKYVEMEDMVSNLYATYSAITSFAIPEILKLNNKTLTALIEDKDFSDYDYMLKTLKNNKKHILSYEEEKILSTSGDVLSSFSQIFSMIDNADLDLGTVLDENKKPVQLSHGAYGKYMQNKDRNFRKRVYEKYYEAYKKLNHVISANYIASVKKDWFYAKTRKYNSCMESKLSANDVPQAVYNMLVKKVNQNLPLLHRYIRLKKRALKVATFKMYDMYVPLVKDIEMNKTYEEAFEIVKQGLAPLGSEYIETLETARQNRWIDVYENKGKRSGAYSTGVYGVHPYVLLNFNGTMHDIFTIAHELGHSMHSYYAEQIQPYRKADYTIFVAEVASTVNEVLLLKHLQKSTTDINLKKYLLNYYIEMIRTTLFRQTQFAEFELDVHTKIENEEPLSSEVLNNLYNDINIKYYGKQVSSDETIKYEWSRIPHFYTPFYVYQYSTGIISAIKIAEDILTKGDEAVKNYKAFLSGGGSDKPTELLKIAGVDLTKREPFDTAFASFKEALIELENLIKED